MSPLTLAAAAIERFVTDAGLDVERLDDGATLFAVHRDEGQWGCLLTPMAGDVVLIESIAPLSVPTTKHRIIAELCGLVNAEVLLGALVLDTDTDQVSVRTAVDIEALASGVEDPIDLAAALLASPVATNIATMARWLLAVVVVLNSATVPSDAVAAIKARG